MQADARQIFVHTTEEGKQPAGFLNRRTFPDIVIVELAGNRERGEAATAPVPPVLRYREDMRDVNGKMSGWECSGSGGLSGGGRVDSRLRGNDDDEVWE